MSLRIPSSRAVSLLHDREDAEGEADALHSLATLARRQGEYELAFTYLDGRQR